LPGRKNLVQRKL